MSGKNSKIREAIIDAALELFREQGYDKVSVNAICKKAYVAHSSFYYLFSGKEDLISYMLRDVMESDPIVTDELVFAANDIERMWAIGSRYLDVCRRIGHEITSSMYQLELRGNFPCLKIIHSADEWFVRFTENAQAQGIIRSTLPASFLGPFILDTAHKIVYDWCSCKGDFNLHRRAREYAEMLLDVAPEYRMTEQQLAEL